MSTGMAHTTLMMLVVIVITFNLADGLWRFSSVELPPNHYLETSDETRYFVSTGQTLIFQNMDEKSTEWIKPNTCDLQLSDKSDAILNCHENGKCVIGKLKSCLNCNDVNVTIRVYENPGCYYWHVESYPSGAYRQLQIKISPILGHSDQSEGDFSSIFTNLFYSRGDGPILKTIVGKNFDIVTSSYNSSVKMWQISLRESEINRSPMISIKLQKHVAILGCTVHPTTVLIDRVTYQSGYEQAVPLKGLNSVIGRIYYHGCAPQNAVLVTEQLIFFTADDFLSTKILYISSEMASTHGIEVQDIAVSTDAIYISIQGKVFAANIKEGSLQFKELAIGGGVDILGITTSLLCLMNANLNAIVTWESSYVAAWSIHQLYLHNNIWSGNNYTWRKLEIPTQYAGAAIIEAKLASQPGYISLLINDDHTVKLLSCLFSRETALSCSAVKTPSEFDTGMYDVEFLNTAKMNIILWSSTSIGYLYDDGEEGAFNAVESVKKVIFNHDHSGWIVQTNSNALFYGSGKCKILMELRSVDPESNHKFTYKFRNMNQEPMRISWNGTDKLSVEIYPLFKEVYSSSQKNENHKLLCDFAYFKSDLFIRGGNVVNLEGIGDKIKVNFTMIHPAINDVKLDLRRNFKNLVSMSQFKKTLSTFNIEGRPLMRVQSMEATLSGKCTKSSAQCSKGIALLEVEVTNADEKATCMMPMSQVLYINVTCPVGLHIRIRNETGQSCHSSNEEQDCIIMMSGVLTFYPIVDLYSFDKFLFTIHDDVKLTEINNRTGFELHNMNLMLKECYLCVQFSETNSTSELILQTPISACPCKLDKHPRDRWTGNISFENSSPPPAGSPNDFVFDVIVLGNSFCELKTRFTLHLLSEPRVLFMLWEYVILLTFILITLLALMISYRKYIIYMRATKLKLS